MPHEWFSSARIAAGALRRTAASAVSYVTAVVYWIERVVEQASQRFARASLKIAALAGFAIHEYHCSRG